MAGKQRCPGDRGLNYKARFNIKPDPEQPHRYLCPRCGASVQRNRRSLTLRAHAPKEAAA